MSARDDNEGAESPPPIVPDNDINNIAEGIEGIHMEDPPVVPLEEEDLEEEDNFVFETINELTFFNRALRKEEATREKFVSTGFILFFKRFLNLFFM